MNKRKNNINMKRSIITILAVAAVLAGCKKGSEVNGGTGTLTIKSLSAESVLNDKNISTGNTKSLPSELADPSDFDITISSNLQGGSSQSYKFAEIADKTLELPAGSYTIKAESHDKATAAWNQPIFEGSKEFSIVAGAVTPVEVKCFLTNAVVSVKYSELFLTELSEYEVKVTGADGNFLTWDKNTAADKDGYFAAGDLEVRIDGVRSLDNSQASISGTIKNVKAKDHIILNIDAKLTGETSSITVNVDGSVNDRESDLFVDGFEEIEIPDPVKPTPDPEKPEPGNPDPSEPEKPAAPTLTWAENPNFDTMELAAEMSVKININAPGKIKDFIVNVKSDALSTILPAMVSPENVKSDGSIDLDLINDAVAIENLSSLLPTGDKLKGQTEVLFELSSLVPLIYQLATVEPDKYDNTNHVFTLKLTDEAGQSLSKEITFHYSK